MYIKNQLIVRKHWLNVLFVLLCLQGEFKAQHVFDRVYTTETGLNSLEVELSFIDQSGVLWLIYVSGEYLSRYDGARWEHIGLEAYRLPPKPELIFESDSLLWLYTNRQSGAALSRRKQNGGWKVFELTGRKFIKPDRITAPTVIDSSLQLWVYEPAVDSFIRSGVTLQSLDNVERHSVPYNLNFRDNYIWSSFVRNVDSRVKLMAFDKVTGEMHGEKSGNNWFEFANFGVIKSEKRSWDTSHQILNYKILINAKDSWIDLYQNGIKTNATTISSNNGEALSIRFEADQKPKAIYQHFARAALKALAHDKHGNIWYGTNKGLKNRRRGIYFIPESESLMVNGLHTIIEDNHERIWFGGYNDAGFCYLEDRRLRRAPLKSLSKGSIMPSAYADSSGKIFYFENASQGIQYFESDNPKKINSLQIGCTGFCVQELSKGRIGAGTLGLGLAVIDGKNVTFLNHERGMKMRKIAAFAEGKDGRIWMGRHDEGIALYEPTLDTVVTWLRSTENLRSFGAISIYSDTLGLIWFGTQKGLSVIQPGLSFDSLTKSFFELAITVTLPENDQGLITLINSTPQYLIIGSSRAIHFLDRTTIFPLRTPKRIYSLWYGKEIPGNGSEQNAICITKKGMVWVGTEQGAIMLDLNELDFDTSTTEIRLKKIFAGDESVQIRNPKDNFVLPIGKRSVLVEWEISGNTHLQDNVTFHILLIKNDKDTVLRNFYMSTCSFSLPYLEPGVYEVQILAIKNNLVSGTKMQKFEIPHFVTERLSFWGIVGLLVAAIPFLIFYFRQREVRAKLHAEVNFQRSNREKDSLRVRALSGFFNPHFINNSLHIVQSRHRKDRQTTKIVGLLSGIIDILFKNTSSGICYQDLRSEITLVENYLYIAEIRFDYRFSFLLPSESEITNLSHTYYLPILLLQICVENAIEKGIKRYESGGKLELSLQETSNGLFIHICDNGIGRSIIPDEVMFRNGSTTVMKELIKTLNIYNDKHITFEYDDFYLSPDNFSTSAYGTRVRIFIPKHFKFELENDHL
jgi:ligand-binding sensor domain-containing protein/flagellar motor protein MotB